MMSLKKEIKNLLEELADLMEFKGENVFKVNAFRNGARTIGMLEDDIEIMIKDDSIMNIKGIGKGLLAVIYEYYNTGKSSQYDDLVKEVPLSVLDLFKIKGLGAKKIRLLFDELKIDSIGKLEISAKNNELAEVKGLGGKTQEKILAEIKRIKKSAGFILLSLALTKAEIIKKEFESLDSSVEVYITGALRRRREVVSSMEFLIVAENDEKFLASLNSLYGYKKLEENKFYTSYSIEMNEAAKVIVYITTPKNQFYSLFQTTGAREFTIELEIKDEISTGSEEVIFKQADFPYVIPEMREVEYLTAPEALKTNSDLELKDFKGFFHFHTTESDGHNSLAEMIAEIERNGFEYAAVCDHSKSAFYAHGLTEDRILQQRALIDELNSKNSFYVYHGIESDILKDGKLDYDDDVLKQFHFIVASIHSNFNMTEEEMTKRIITAIENPYTDLIAHPTGRLLLARDSYPVNIKKVIDACAVNKVAIEINANPHRLDLDWRHLYYAREKGCLIGINPDAHSIDGVSDINYGIMMARKGGVQKKDVINCLNENDFINFINRKTNRLNREVKK